MSSRYSIINLIAYLSLVIINVLAVQVPFFGRTPGDVSDLYPNLLTPADFAFKIWSVIYVLLGIFAYHQAKNLFQKDTAVPKEVTAIGLLFLGSSFFNFGWLMAWQSMHILWSFVLILILWILLILINYRLTILEKTKWLYRVPFSFYLAWVCITALANLNVLLIDLEFGFFGLTEESWTAMLIGIGICGTLLVLYLNQDLWFTGVLIWAFFGMYVKNQRISDDTNWVIIMSLFAIFFLLIIGTWVGFRKWNQQKQVDMMPEVLR